MTFENLDMLIMNDLRAGKVPMLIGEPGIGKSSYVEALAAKMGTVCFTLAVNQLADKADMTGARLVPVTGKNGEQDYEQKFFPHQVINQAIAYATDHPAETPILFMDEINRTTPDVTSEALSIPTARSIGAKVLPENLKVIVAGNDKGNVQSLDKASITRFVLYRIEPDLGTFLAVNPNLNPYVANVLKKNPRYLFLDTTITGVSADEKKDGDDDSSDEVFEMDLTETMEQITTPRTVTAVSDWLNGYAYDELVTMMNTMDGDQSLLQSALEAHAGRTAFTLALMDEIISKQIVAGPQTNITEPAKYRALCNAQSRDEMNDQLSRMTDEEKSAILVYAIYDNRDNAGMLAVLAPMVNRIQPNDMTNFVNLAQAKRLNKGNYDALCSTPCIITTIIQAMNL